jgi:hypothetical protein
VWLLEYRRQRQAIVGVEPDVVEKLLEFCEWRANRVIVQVEEQVLVGPKLGHVVVATQVMSNSEVEDQVQEGFLVASHEEAVEEDADLIIDVAGGFSVQKSSSALYLSCMTVFFKINLLELT